MFTLRARSALVVAALAVAVILLAAGQPSAALPLAAAVLLVYGGVRYGPMRPAFRAYLRSDWPRLSALLGEVRRPGWLRPQERAYYELLSGALALARGDVAAAQRHLVAADAARLRTDHLRCVLELHRSGAALAAGDRVAAAAHLSAARALPHRAEAEPEIARLAALVAAG